MSKISELLSKLGSKNESLETFIKTSISNKNKDFRSSINKDLVYLYDKYLELYEEPDDVRYCFKLHSNNLENLKKLSPFIVYHGTHKDNKDSVLKSGLKLNRSDMNLGDEYDTKIPVVYFSDEPYNLCQDDAERVEDEMVWFEYEVKYDELLIDVHSYDDGAPVTLDITNKSNLLSVVVLHDIPASKLTLISNDKLRSLRK